MCLRLPNNLLTNTNDLAYLCRQVENCPGVPRLHFYKDRYWYLAYAGALKDHHDTSLISSEIKKVTMKHN